MPTNKTKTTTQKDSKIFDVTKPGETPADQTSRPIIVGHGKMMQQDPMMVEQDEPTDTEPTLPIQKKSELKIQPAELSGSEDQAPPRAETSDEANQQSESPSPKPLKPDLQPNTETDNSSEDSDGGAVDALANEASSKLQKQKKDEETTKRSAEIQKLIDTKQYFVHTKTPPGKRNTYLLFFLLAIATLGAAGWYLMLGPGKDLWAREMPPTVTVPIAAPTAKPQVQAATTEYKNPALGFALNYPKDWKAEVGKDTARIGVDVVALSSGPQKVKLAGGSQVDAFLRFKVYALNTTDLKKYPTQAVGLSECTITPITIEKSSYKLAFTSSASNAGASRLLVTATDCSKSKPFVVSDQFQLSNKKNSYSITAEYVLSEAYLKSTGVVDADEITLSQKNGISVSEQDIKAAASYKELLALLNSLKVI